MRFTAPVFSLLIWISSAGLAGATTCYQGAAIVWDATSGRALHVVLSLALSGKDDKVSRMHLSGHGFVGDSTLFCSRKPIVCQLEEDGGRATLASNASSLTFVPSGRLQISRGDGYVFVMPHAHDHRQDAVLRAISESRCKSLFPTSNKIIISNPPSYDSDQR
jgi:hypothetical protein